MTRRDTIAFLASVTAASMLSGCGAKARSRFRFRMTVEVETAQGLRTGSGVMELSAALARFKLPDSAAVDLRFKGEAVAVDLPGGKLFALVGKTPAIDSFEGAVINTFDHRRPGEAKLVAMIGELGRPSSLGREAVMRPQDYPTLVRFRNLRDPRTVEIVDPNDLTKSFGAGVRLKQILFAIVNLPITTGIERHLPKSRANGFYDYAGTGRPQDQSNFDGSRFFTMNDFISWSDVS